MRIFIFSYSNEINMFMHIKLFVLTNEIYWNTEIVFKELCSQLKKN